MNQNTMWEEDASNRLLSAAQKYRNMKSMKNVIDMKLESW